MPDGLEKTSIAWHPAFISATEYDLRAEAEKLTFETEHNLSKEPLRMDLLIIKKNGVNPIDNDIARIFRKHNIIEYKSPDDGLSIDDFYKTLGYACLYKGLATHVNEIPADEITISLFREGYPVEMIKMLRKEGACVEEKAPGIYYISGMQFPAQIIVTGRLDPEKHSSLRILPRNAKEEDIKKFIEEVAKAETPGDKNNIDAILQVSVSANQKIYNELQRRNKAMCEALRELMKDEINREIDNAVKNTIDNTRRETAYTLRDMGMDDDAIAKAVHVTVDVIKQWFSPTPAI